MELTRENMKDRFLKRFNYGFDFSIGPGWWPLVADLDEKLCMIDANYTVDQIKEKFGGLRFYATMSDGAANTRADILGLGSLTMRNEQAEANPAFDEFMAAIDAAEDASYKVCEECGAPGVLCASGGGWLMTRCEACAEKEGVEVLEDEADGNDGENEF